MMTNQMIANQINRDEQLTNFLCVDAQRIRADLETWIREELIQSMHMCSVMLEVETDGLLKDCVESALNRLRHIEQYEIGMASGRSKRAEEEFRSGEADNAFDGYELVMRAQSDLVRIARELLDIRDRLIPIAN